MVKMAKPVMCVFVFFPGLWDLTFPTSESEHEPKAVKAPSLKHWTEGIPFFLKHQLFLFFNSEKLILSFFPSSKGNHWGFPLLSKGHLK